MRKSQRNDKISEESPPPESESEFSFTLARAAVAQICQSKGFSGARSPALEALTDVAIRYLEAIAKLSAGAANSSGRTQSNVFDVAAAVEDLASVQGFPECSSVRSRSLCKSAVIKDLIRFVKYTDEIPFAQPLPPWRNSFHGGRGSLVKCRDSGRWYNAGRLKHVPRWLPAVPVVEEGREKREEREREAKWESLVGEERRREGNWEFDELKAVKRERSNEVQKLEKRGRVRFKMGVELGDQRLVGKLRGVGIGKRVWCE